MATAHPTYAGPYATEEAARADCPVLYEGSGGITTRLNLKHLTEACAEAGVGLGAYDRRILTRLAGWEQEAVQVVVGLIARAHSGGSR